MEWTPELVRNEIQQQLSDLLYVSECYERIGKDYLEVIFVNGQKFKIRVEEA